MKPINLYYNSEEADEILKYCFNTCKELDLNLGVHIIRRKWVDETIEHIKSSKKKLQIERNHSITFKFCLPNNTRTGKVICNRVIIGELIIDPGYSTRLLVYPYRRLTCEEMISNDGDCIRKIFTDKETLMEYLSSQLTDAMRETIRVWHEYCDLQKKVKLSKANWATALALEGFD